MKDKQLNTILDECLERMLVDGETVAQCLERYPEYATELEPLLQTAMIANEAVDIRPSPEFKARARFQLRTEMTRADVKSRRSIFAWQPRWAVSVVTVMVVVLLGGDLKSDPEVTAVLRSDELDRLFDLEHALRHVDEIFERTLR